MDIPGYYFDKEKNRYFRVESSGTGPQSAAWTARNVKRRKVQDAAAEETRRQAVRAASRIKRVRALLNESVEGGFYAREYSGLDGETVDLPTRYFARGLSHAGVANLFPRGHTAAPNTNRRPVMPACMYVGAETNDRGLCTVHSSPLGGTGLYSTYIARNKKNHIDQRALANYRLSSPLPPPYIESGGFLETLNMATAVKYHKPSNLMLVSSRVPGVALGAYGITLNRDDGPWRPRWDFPTRNPEERERETAANPSFGGEMEAFTVTPAPGDASDVCAWGTDRGVVVSPNSPADLRHQFLYSNSVRKERPDLLADVFAVDYMPGQSKVLRFGGRGGSLVNADTRESALSWTYIDLPSAITHVNCIGREKGGDCVLVAGLGNQLGVYDLRLSRLRTVGSKEAGDGDDTKVDHHNNLSIRTSRSSAAAPRPSKQQRNRRSRPPPRRSTKRDRIVERPVICFERYRNAAYIDIGFAYDAATGVVAAAHDDDDSGSVGLYSVRTGAQLQLYRGFDTDALPLAQSQRQQRGIHRLPDTGPTVIRALQFQTFPGDSTPTLFVGAGGSGANLTAFSVNATDTTDGAEG